MKTIKLCDVKVNEDFLNTSPSEKKIKRVKKYVEENGRLDIPIILDNNGVIVDGYIRYLVAKELNFDEIPYVEFEKMQYIVGRFENTDIVHTWRNDRGIDIHVGDRVIARVTRNKKRMLKCVVVEDIFRSDSLEMYKKHKSVIKTLENN